MIELPVADPGRPDTRSPVRLLLWVGRHQLSSITIAVVFGILWMVSQALMPYAIGQAIQQGIVEGDNNELVRFCILLAALGIVQVLSGIMRHRYAVQNWLAASYRLIQVVGYHSARSGDAIRRELSTGEVVATVSNDALRAGGAFEILARLAGGIVAYVVVAIILLSTSPKLGLLVLLGVPILTLSLTVVIKPLQQRQREQRDEVGKLTALGADTAAGLRVLRGVGGEHVRPLGAHVRRAAR
jgi:ABC-type multidrug transport system fused ATPase/permease subunit